MRRRELITLVGGAVALPLAARAQQPTTPVVGFLNSLRESDRPNLQAAFRRGLGEAGYVDGRNVTIEYRYAENQHNRLPALAADLIRRKVAVIAATGGGASILAAKAATKTIPIVFTTGGDAVQQGYVASLNRPGGNVTGVSWFSNLIAGKGLGLLHELLPNAAVIAMLLNPKLPESARMQSEGHEAARKLGQQLFSMPARPTRSMPLSPQCANGAPARFLSGPILSYPADPSRLLPWRRVMRSRPCTITAQMSKRVG